MNAMLLLYYYPMYCPTISTPPSIATFLIISTHPRSIMHTARTTRFSPNLWCTMYHAMSYHVISYRIIPYHIMSWHVMSYNIIKYHIISYHITHGTIMSYKIILFLKNQSTFYNTKKNYLVNLFHIYEISLLNKIAEL